MVIVRAAIADSVCDGGIGDDLGPVIQRQLRSEHDRLAERALLEHLAQILRFGGGELAHADVIAAAIARMQRQALPVQEDLDLVLSQPDPQLLAAVDVRGTATYT